MSLLNSKLKQLAVGVSLALSGSLAMANGLSYDYLDVGTVDYDGADGFKVELSNSINKDFYSRIEYSSVDVDGFNADLDQWLINLGYSMAVSDSTDFVAELGYENADASIAGFSGSEDGFNALVGLRSMATKKVELGAFAKYSDVFESTDITVEARYHFTNDFSVAIEAGNDEELDEHYGVSVRFNF